MRSKSSTTRVSIASATVVAILLAACERGDSQPASSAAQNAGQAAPAASTARSERWSYQDWPTGPYKVAENWPKPLPDTRHSHDGWTWGSFGGVYAESPDRIWIAMRGELPLPAGAAPWTPYAALLRHANSTGNGDGITATCGDEPKRGWERRFEHSIIVVNRDGELVDEWPELEKLFSAGPCGRGPHQIKISPYDPEKHVWIIDDQLHMIYRFTYDGKLEMSKGELGRTWPRTEHVRPPDRRRVAARRHVLHHRRLRRHARREVRQERQLRPATPASGIATRRGHRGLGFREHGGARARPRRRRWPPVRASSPTLSASTACSKASARPTSPTWTRPSTACSRRSSAPAACTPSWRCSARSTAIGRAPSATSGAAAAPVARDDHLRQGDLPLHRRDLRAVPGPFRRVPHARHLGPVLAPGDRVLRALRGARARAARGRGPGALGGR